MKKTIKNILFVILLTLSYANMAAAKATNDNKNDIDYYEDEGRLLFKIRALGLKTNSKQKGLPAVAAPNPSGALIQSGFGIDSATAIFFNDNIATELSLGINVLRVKNSTIADIASSYGNTSYSSKRKDIYMVPLTLTIQYHIAPFGAIRPYVGGGYHAAYMLTRSKAFKVGNGHGGVLQAGVDLVAKDDTLINFDIRQYFAKTKVTYKSAAIGSKTDIASKIKLNPLVISLGIGFKL